MIHPGSSWLTVAEVASRFGVSRTTVLRWVEQRRVTVKRGYGTLVISEASVMHARGRIMRAKRAPRPRAA